MPNHHVEYARQRRRSHAIPTEEPFSSQKFLLRAAELRRLEQMPWPMTISGKPATIAELLAVAAQSSEQDGESRDGVCPCGCGKDHKRNVSQALRRPRGCGFDVRYFWSEACKSKWNRGRSTARAV